MQGIEHRLEQLMRYRRLRSVRNGYETREATFSCVKIKEKCGINYPKVETPFFSSDRREKTGVLRGYCRNKGPKNIC